MEGEIDPRLRAGVLAQHPQYPALPPIAHGVIHNNNNNPNPLRPSPLDPMHPSAANDNSSKRRTSADSPSHGQSQPYYDLNAIDPSNSSEHGVDAGPGVDPKRSRACEACRGLKVRCQPDESNYDGPCKRCAKAGRKCIVTVPSRKRQKKTDSRVAELEKKIDALTASLQARRSDGREGDSESDGYEMEDDHRGHNPAMADGQKADRDGVRRSTGNTQDATSYRGRNNSVQKSETQSPVTYRSSLNQISGVKRRHSNEGIAQTYGTSSSTGVNSPSTKPSPKDGPPSIYSFLMPKISKNQPPPTPEPSTVQLPSPSHDYTDVIDRGLLSSDTASVIFDKYAKEMTHHMPVVVFPEGVTAGEIRKTKPTLFLAILSVGSGAFYPDLQRLLTPRDYEDLWRENHVLGRKES